MKNLLYTLLKPLIRAGLYSYYREVRMIGTDRIPAGKPVMFLPNHHNALMDPLLIAACIRGQRPYFLTRSDVFRGQFLRRVFSVLRMIPVYRLRDGRDTLSKNEAIFDQCASLLANSGQLLLFPEANHNLGRRVRPLSKGFTRIAIHTLQKYPETDLQLMPVGINYQKASGFPDRVAFYFGHPIPARSFLPAGSPQEISREMKNKVSERLKSLTTHIPDDRDYGETVQRLERESPDWLNPDPINRWLAGASARIPSYPRRNSAGYRLWDLAMRIVNLPVWLLWRWIARNKVWEPEFMDTFRFLYALLAFPVYLGLIGVVLWIAGAAGYWYLALPGLLLFNLLYVKLR